jgi:hypothetical protein
MQVIRPNCRAQFSAEDIDFIVETLGKTRRDCLIDLLKDEESRDLILDDELLFRAVLERPECLRISMHLYFYILVRNVFRGSGLAERELADYVAEVLAEFSQTHRTQMRLNAQGKPMDYFVDMLAALQTADDLTSFFIRAHMGNYSLFLSGVFPDRIRIRSERKGAPDIRYYEEIGRSSFRAASDHRLAYKYDVAEIFNTLSERFQTTRRALNDLGDRLISLEPPTKIGM